MAYFSSWGSFVIITTFLEKTEKVDMWHELAWLYISKRAAMESSMKNNN